MIRLATPLHRDMFTACWGHFDLVFNKDLKYEANMTHVEQIWTNLRPVCNVFSTLANEPDCFHASVRECSIACKLRQAFYCILEWVDYSQKIPFKDARCKHTTQFSTHYYATTMTTKRWLCSVMVRGIELWSTGCEFDSRPCTAGLVLRQVTIGHCG